ncbi:tRNA (cytosine(32)/uridine(32)-2'-O)-methyltransferase TrmJ [Litoribacillus peritrichatus]|uniref:tRNA (cytidine/uridine-2'-O-)-methyltransferase TrmJ n=1 Tax=Litoribacillus peritrichatus TaxID=718191 RepID=A0ABP7M3P3_9GAMM
MEFQDKAQSEDASVGFQMLSNIRIVMVNTTHPGNIGAAARAMKTMGLSELVLVEPKRPIDDEAIARSSGATDVLESAQIVPSLEEAIEDCGLVIGTSARSRSIPWPLLNPRQCAEQSVLTSKRQKVAIIFGREDRGLTNEELAKCNFHVHIPTNPDYSSLNIGAAIQVICYEMRMAIELQVSGDEQLWGVEWDRELASSKELDGLIDHLEQVMVTSEFLDPENPRYIMTRMRRLFNRAMPDKVEVNVFRGILSSITKKLGR